MSRRLHTFFYKVYGHDTLHEYMYKTYVWIQWIDCRVICFYSRLLLPVCAALCAGYVSALRQREECRRGRKEGNTHTQLSFSLPPLVSRILHFLWPFPPRHTNNHTLHLTTLDFGHWSPQLSLCLQQPQTHIKLHEQYAVVSVFVSEEDV